MTEQARQLRKALLDMVDRYSVSVERLCGAVSTERRHHLRAAHRQYQAIMRLSRALAELSART